MNTKLNEVYQNYDANGAPVQETRDSDINGVPYGNSYEEFMHDYALFCEAAQLEEEGMMTTEEVQVSFDRAFKADNTLSVHIGHKDGSWAVAAGCVFLKEDGTCTADGTHCTAPNCDGHMPVSATSAPPGEHSECGEADEDGCPVHSDCGCRGAEKQGECAGTGCGFCRAAQR